MVHVTLLVLPAQENKQPSAPAVVMVISNLHRQASQGRVFKIVNLTNIMIMGRVLVRTVLQGVMRVAVRVYVLSVGMVSTR